MGLVLKRSGDNILHFVHIADREILDALNRAPEAWIVILWSRKTRRIRVGVQGLVDKETD
jgi:hypothetical protein